MEKKYIIKLKENEIAYKTVNSNGCPMIGLLHPVPYTEPDLEQVRCAAYEEGRNSLLIEVQKAGKNTIKLEEDEYYQRGLADAWEAARKISSMDSLTRDEVFGLVITSNIFDENTASEAIEKIRQYEQEKEEIKVGDEVNWMGDKYVVIYVRCKAKKADLISCEFGSACENVAFSALVKTGRHFPEIAEVMQKMKEEE